MGLRDIFMGDSSPASGDNPVAGATDVETVKEEIRKRGRPKSESKLRQAAEERRAAAAVEALYEDENWEAIGCLYFDVRYAMTGYQGFRLSEKQAKILATSTAMLMKTLIEINPKYVALIVWCVNFGGIVSAKEMEWRAVRKAQEKAKGNGA